MASPTYRSSTNSTISSKSSESVALPSGAANNDIIVVIILKESTGALSPPALFTDGINGFQVGQVNSTNSEHQITVFAVRYLTSGQSWPYTVSWTGAVNSQYISVAISGSVTSGTPIVGTPATGSNAGTTGPSLSTTPGVANCLLCYAGGSYDGMTASFSGPANMGGGDLAEDPSWEAFYCDLAVSGSGLQTSGTWSTSYSDDHTGIFFALASALASYNLLLNPGSYAESGISLLISYSGSPITLSNFWFRNDDGSESGATWRGSQNFNNQAPSGANIRIRIQLDSQHSPTSQNFNLEYRKQGDTTWAEVTN